MHEECIVCSDCGKVYTLCQISDNVKLISRNPTKPQNLGFMKVKVFWLKLSFVVGVNFVFWHDEKCV